MGRELCCRASPDTRDNERHQGWVEADWGLSENNRHAKFYRLSHSGRAQLHTGASTWHQFVEAASRALRTTTAP